MTSIDAPPPATTSVAGSSPVRAAFEKRTRSFTELAQLVRTSGLNGRTHWFYLVVASTLITALGGAITGMILLGDSWFQLLIAAALGIIFTQFAFLGHEASHRQVLKSAPANDRLGRVLSTAFVGISYSWWMNKHTRHHANPNKVGKDPDIALGNVAFTTEDAAQSTGFRAWVIRRQGWLFFPLLLLVGLDLHQTSIRSLFSRKPQPGRVLELSLIAGRFALYLGALFWLLPLGMAFAFLGVQLAVFGVYMGASFAPNHIGMRIVPADVRLDFLNKQVLTSRNVRGGWWITTVMGGLNFQIEHHLFPNMPRPHLRQTQRLVRAACDEHDISYTENSLPQALAIVVRYMNEVGLVASAKFQCPTAAGMGRF